MYGRGGTSAAGFFVGGDTGSPINNTEEWNGSAWSAGGSYPISARSIGGDGSSTAAIAFGGATPPPHQTGANLYDGTSWAATASLPVGAEVAGGAGTTQNAISIGGTPSGTNTQAFTGAGPVTQTITTS
jgi:hypothetical protein